MGNCIKCNCENPEHDLRFVKVNQVSSSTTSYRGLRQVTTTTTTENFTGVDRACICEKCIKGKRLANSFLNSLIGLVGGFIVSILFMAFILRRSNDVDFGPVALFCLVVGIVIAIIAFLVNITKGSAFIAGEIVRKIRGEKTVQFVPVDQSLYINKKTGQADLETFKSKSGLKTGVGQQVFLLFVATGVGNDLVDKMLAEGTSVPSDIDTAPQETTTHN